VTGTIANDCDYRFLESVFYAPIYIYIYVYIYIHVYIPRGLLPGRIQAQ
jgi:hypothetical protein